MWDGASAAPTHPTSGTSPGVSVATWLGVVDLEGVWFRVGAGWSAGASLHANTRELVANALPGLPADVGFLTSGRLCPLDVILADLAAHTNGRRFVVGGDLNAAPALRRPVPTGLGVRRQRGVVQQGGCRGLVSRRKGLLGTI